MPTFKKRAYECGECGKRLDVLAWDYEPSPVCHGTMEPYEAVNHFGRANSVIQDSIPGGEYIEHGLCHSDGTPRRFDSKSDIRKAARERGWTRDGDTPKPAGDRWV